MSAGKSHEQCFVAFISKVRLEQRNIFCVRVRRWNKWMQSSSIFAFSLCVQNAPSCASWLAWFHVCMRHVHFRNVQILGFEDWRLRARFAGIHQQCHVRQNVNMNCSGLASTYIVVGLHWVAGRWIEFRSTNIVEQISFTQYRWSSSSFTQYRWANVHHK